jgi:DNA-binding winged helix-turn-helix (wHTH) protein
VQYLFGDYALDPDRRELTRRAEAVAIGPKVFDLLLFLVPEPRARRQQG